MNRDNLLFALMGLVVGFVLAYPVFESMSTRQPALRPPGQVSEGGAVPGGGAPGAPGMGGGGMGGGPASEQVRQLQERIRANPEDAEAILELAQLNFSINERERARDLLEQYHGLRPQDTATLLVLANLSFDTRAFDKARQYYEQYLGTEAETPDILTDLGVSYRNLDQPQKALELFDRAQEMQPGHWVSLYNEVVVLAFDLQQFDEANQALARLQEMQPGNQDVQRLVEEVERRRSGAA